MAQGMNKVILLGHLGGEPELRTTDAGLAVLKLRMATNEFWVDQDGNRKERTEWHRATVFGKRAEALAKHLRKGSAVLIEGRLRTSSYDKEGAKHYSTEVLIDELCFAASRPSAGHGAHRGDTTEPLRGLDRAPGLAAGGGQGRGDGPENGASRASSWRGAAAAMSAER